MRPILFAVALAVSVPASAETRAITVFGAGYWSCAKWQMTQANRTQGEVWILGAVTALNGAAYDANNGAPQVGDATDGAGIIGEVAKRCWQAPSTPVYFVVRDVYNAMRAAGR